MTFLLAPTAKAMRELWELGEIYFLAMHQGVPARWYKTRVSMANKRCPHEIRWDM